MKHTCGQDTIHGKKCKMRVKNSGEHCFLHRASSHNDICSICHEEMCSQCKSLQCGHEFHRKCILQWKNSGKYTCPVCREHFCEPPKKYKVTVSIENITNGSSRTFTLDDIPQFIEDMGIVTDDAYLTEAYFEVSSEDLMRQVLDDLGIQNPLDLL